MQTALNRQEVLGEVNPLFRKFVKEGENPTTYIPADTRRKIYDFMGKTNYTKGVLGKFSSRLFRQSESYVFCSS